MSATGLYVAAPVSSILSFSSRADTFILVPLVNDEPADLALSSDEFSGLIKAAIFAGSAEPTENFPVTVTASAGVAASCFEPLKSEQDANKASRMPAVTYILFFKTRIFFIILSLLFNYLYL